MAACILVVNEVASRRASTALQRNIRYADVRVASARVLQLLTDAETGQRGYLLTERPEYREPLTVALRELPEQRQLLRSYFAGTDDQPRALAIDRAIDHMLEEMNRTMQDVDAGRREAALAVVNIGVGKQLMDSLRTDLEAQRDEIGRLQLNGRAVIVQSIRINRLAIPVLTLLLALGLYLLVRQRRAWNSERRAREATLEAQVRDRTLKISNLLRHLNASREEEKSRMARELHDELGASLTAVAFEQARLRSQLLQNPTLNVRLDNANKFLNQGIEFNRRIIEELRPSTLTTFGLKTALSVLCSESSERSAIPVHADIAEIRLPPDIELAAFRLVQEALANIRQHASARNAWVRVAIDGNTLVVVVRDDGRGFDAQKSEGPRHGQLGMQFRVENLGGELRIESEAGSGTRVVARLPVYSDPALTGVQLTQP